ncbi:UNVERIFIED_CONTAM: YTH domain-containing protein ECT2 [Sesamum latifolium]|uniref:YTH domain-containing protein ECT2 n=1 Tax=Sesamum latifolium TaxID=2727402 RepID=A0AAW2XMR9_9LAMI
MFDDEDEDEDMGNHLNRFQPYRLESKEQAINCWLPLRAFIVHQTPAMIITIMDTTAPFHSPMTKVISRRLPVLAWVSNRTLGFVGVDGKQAYTSPAGYLQQLCSYGSEAFPCYAYDLAYAETRSAAAATRSRSLRPVIASSGSGKSHAFPLNPQLQQHASRSLISPIYQTQPPSPIKKFGSGSPSSGLMTGFHPAEKFSSFANQNPSVFTRYGNNTSKLPYEVKQQRDEYNLKEFRTEYDSAKFYVIKSYSEDDIHKCIKYDVWSSTLHGNKKLDAGLREAEAKGNQTGKRSPVFLFFSVNGSGQFVGVAEMIGRVDFSTDMDFWQLDKWHGYFPVKWHIIKDVPNTLLRHIILKNNENRPVTYSRDTQEIGLEQGLEMLRIFKNYSEKTSVLDDFNFYEHRDDEAIKVKRNTKPASRTNRSKSSAYKKHFEGGEGMFGQQSAKINKLVPSSLTKNLSPSSSKDPGPHNAHDDDDQQMKSAAAAVDSDCRRTDSALFFHPTAKSRNWASNKSFKNSNREGYCATVLLLSMLTCTPKRYHLEAQSTPYYEGNRAHVCSFYVGGQCTRGPECPYRHEMPVEVNDPVALKLLNKAGEMPSLEPPEDESIRTLYVGGVTEQDLRDNFYTHGEFESVEMALQRACAFVTYTTREGAAEELANKLVIRGLRLLNFYEKSLLHSFVRC